MIVEIRHNEQVVRKDLLLITHRGGKGFGPENTLDSLRRALEFGVEMVETDVRMTSDRIPIIHHGPFFGLHLLSNMTLSEIREHSAEVPTLKEYLELAGDKCRLNLEIKKCDPSVLLRALKETPTCFPPLISSFDSGFLLELNSLVGDAELGLLSRYDTSHDHIVEEAARCGAGTLLPASYLASRDLIDRAHGAEMRIITWTINNINQLADLIRAGVDGIITDVYPELKEFLETEGMESGTIKGRGGAKAPPPASHEEGLRK